LTIGAGASATTGNGTVFSATPIVLFEYLAASRYTYVVPPTRPGSSHDVVVALSQALCRSGVVKFDERYLAIMYAVIVVPFVHVARTELGEFTSTSNPVGAGPVGVCAESEAAQRPPAIMRKV